MIHDVPKRIVLLLAAIEVMKGHARPAVQRRRQPSSDLPAHLKESFRGGWNDPQVKEVAAELQQRRRTAPKHLSPNRSGRHLRPFGLKMAREGMLWLW
jgi:hypothetical protein